MNLQNNQMIVNGVRIALIGFIFSGPVGFILVNLLHPQPAWTTSLNFARNYHFIQDFPFYFGFLLIGGMLMVVAGHYLSFRGEENQRTKFRLLLAVAWTVVFCTLISFNYICQVAFIHNLAMHYAPENDAAIAMFSMSNPGSFCWANEMWGYGFLGMATWLMADFYTNRNTIIRRLLIANGIVSILSPFITILDPMWVMTPAGLVAYFIWNALMIVAMVCIYWETTKKSTAP